jgi:hypothetical protein
MARPPSQPIEGGSQPARLILSHAARTLSHARPTLSPAQLPVPELPPFRLTRQLQGLFLPHAPGDVLGPSLAALLGAMGREAQVGAWGCGRRCSRLPQHASSQSRPPTQSLTVSHLFPSHQPHPHPHPTQVLMSVMAIFLAEPLLDWQREANHVAAMMGRGGRGEGGAPLSQEELQQQHMASKVRALSGGAAAALTERSKPPGCCLGFQKAQPSNCLDWRSPRRRPRLCAPTARVRRAAAVGPLPRGGYPRHRAPQAWAHALLGQGRSRRARRQVRGRPGARVSWGGAPQLLGPQSALRFAARMEDAG